MRYSSRRTIQQKTTIFFTIINVLLFMAINPAITNAQEDQSISFKKWLGFVKAPIKETGAGKYKGNLSADSNKGIILDDESLKMISLINQERVAAGLEKLESDAVLTKLAREKGLDMVRHNYFGHYSERLGTVYNQLDQEKCIYRFAAENLIEAPNYRRAFQSLLASPAHRSNLLNPRFKKIGIGVIKGGTFGKTIVQIITD